MDPTLHKFVANCQRIFKVPVVLISLADVNEQWMISNVGLEVMQKDKIEAFSALILSPDIPDVLIVADALSDERFSSNLLVTESPFIRFYACAAVIVEDVRIGSLCIFNSKARHDFCEEDKMNLLDFGSAVSSFITLQRKVTMAINDQKYATNSVTIEKNNLMVDMMHQVRTPLMSIQLNTSLVESKQLELAEYLKEDTHGTALSNHLATFLSDLKSGISQLDTFVTSSVKLEEPLIQSDNNNNNNNNNNNRTTKDVLTQFHWKDLFITIENYLLSHSIDIEWHVDNKLIRDDTSIRSYPSILKGILTFIINNVMIYWKKAKITVHFKSYHNDTTTTTTTTTLVSKVDNSNIIITTSGYLTVMINMCQPHDTSTSTTTTTTTTSDSIPLFIDLQSIQRQLVEIGGNYRSMNFDSSSSSSSSYFESSHKVEEQFFECCLPCDLCLPSSCFNNNNDITSDKGAYTMDIEHDRILTFFSTNNFLLKRQSSILSSYSGESTATLTRLPPPQSSLSVATTTTTAAAATATAINKKKGDEMQYDSNVITLESWDPEHEKLLQKQWQKKESYNNNNNNNNKLCYDLSYHSSSSSSFSLHRPLKILVVDDSIAIYKVLKRWLETEGCDVTVAENGWIGLTYLKTQTFDITLMDFIMPVMLGRDAMRLFQEWKLESCLNNSNDDMLLVGMSANASQRDQEEAYQYGMHFFASKPVDLDFLSIILSAKSKCQSLPKAVQEITLKKAKIKSNPNNSTIDRVGDTPTTNISTSNSTTAADNIPIYLQRKRDRIKKTSPVFRSHHRQQLPTYSNAPTHQLSTNGHDNITELTSTNVNIYLSSTINDADANGNANTNDAKRNLQKLPKNSLSHTFSSWNFLSQFRQNLFSHFFSGLISQPLKIIPSPDSDSVDANAITDN